MIHVSALEVRLSKPFRIAHGTSTIRRNALVQWGDGLGESGLPPYLGIDYEDVQGWLEGLKLRDPSAGTTPPVSSILAGLPEGPKAARCALDLAVHDAWGKAIGQPLHVLFGLDPAKAPNTFRTVSIPDDVRTLSTENLPEGSLLKVKVGTGDIGMDVELVHRVRDLSNATLGVDANGAWSIPEAVQALPRLKDLGVEFVEQPISTRDPEDWHLLCRLVPQAERPKLIADESVRSAEDAIALSGAADGVNLKLAKCGGLEAVRHLAIVARSLDLSVMLGCMVESSLAITAAAHLAPLADYVDLDGAELLAWDPFEGVTFDAAGMRLPTRPGIGARKRTNPDAA